jgi:hypothetical protein
MSTFAQVSYSSQQNLPAALPAVPRLLGCSALRAKDALRPAKRELGYAGLGQALRAHFSTGNGFTG